MMAEFLHANSSFHSRYSNSSMCRMASPTRQGVGLRCVIRNIKEATTMKRVKDCLPADLAKAKGILFALKVASKLGCPSIIYEDDNLGLIQAISPKRVDINYCGSTVLEILAALDCFSNASVEFVPRTATRVAHIMAKQS
ncbi:conserved hypothetical protein [Ricinus communis]|uniref:RNase H type-1 domain-containing protein n=1 Tax=Ricinus communis TaxID=3988 RepID=B9SY05_RICCO|nr:conserved hypothetical protein [Ricinus communis]